MNNQLFVPGDWVRIRLNGSSPHHVGAQIISVNQTSAIVRPISHRRLERVELALCRLWKSKNATYGRRPVMGEIDS